MKTIFRENKLSAPRMFLFTSVVACAPRLLFSIHVFHEFLKLFNYFLYIFLKLFALRNVMLGLSKLSLLSSSASPFPFFSRFSTLSVISSVRDIPEQMLARPFFPTSNPNGLMYSFYTASVTFVTFFSDLKICFGRKLL